MAPRALVASDGSALGERMAGMLAAGGYDVACAAGDDQERLVVCVDDDAAFLRSLEQALPARLASAVPFQTGYEFFQDSAKAAALLSDADRVGAPIAMVVADQVMPGFDGVQLLGLVPNAVRVLLTGHAGIDALVSAVNQQALDYYVAKPIDDLDSFTRTLAHLLREHHLSAVNRVEAWRTIEQYEFLKGLARLNSLDETLDAVINFISATLDADRVSVMLSDGDQLTIRAARGIPEDVVASTSLPIGSGVAGRVFQTGVPICVTDRGQAGVETTVDSPYSVFASVPIVVAPMRVGRRPLGIINVTNRRNDQALTRSELMFLAHTADAASIAISNHLEREEKEKAHFDTIRSLALAVEAKDQYTRGHSERVAAQSVQIARRLGLSPREVQEIERSAIMHDVGKIGVPEHIIHKPGALTDEEFEHIRRHPVVGESIVSQLKFMARSLPVIRGHHEWFDGSGYPDGLRGEAISLGARIVGVADAYDAMTSERPYRGQMSSEAALAEIRACSGTQFDPLCVYALIEVLRSVPAPAGIV